MCHFLGFSYKRFWFCLQLFFFFSFRIYKHSHLSLIWMFINLPFFLPLEYLYWEFCVDVSIKCKIFWIFKLCVQIMTLILSTRFEILSLNKNRERNWKKKKRWNYSPLPPEVKPALTLPQPQKPRLIHRRMYEENMLWLM